MAIIELYDPRRKDKIVHVKSGLNWGVAKAHVRMNDAYLPLRKDFLRANRELFLAQGEQIDVIWDDVEMVCLLEGTQDLDGKRVPKQLSIYNDKSVLGAYLRKG